MDKEYVDTICIGLERFCDKIGYQSNVYAKNGETIKYLVHDVYGNSQKFIDKYNADARIVPMGIMTRVKTLICTLCKVKSKNVELYSSGSKMVIFYAVVAKLFRRNLIVILRGLEFSKGKLQVYLTKRALKLADLVIAKEYNLLEDARKCNLGNKLCFVHNAIPYHSRPLLTYDERDVDIIFMNSPRKKRHVVFLLEVFKRLLDEMPALKIILAGFSVLNEKKPSVEIEYQEEVLDRIRELGLEDKITILGFVSYGGKLLRRSKIFVFPAEIVFCNYALLESMSYGCVPVVADGEGADMIVAPNINGMICHRDVEFFKESISQCLGRQWWDRLSPKAVETIRERFSIDEWYDKIRKAKEGVC
ncbi:MULTISPECIES: glycosyltransferase family 4 protein [Butyricimonas]|uniref:glycosyltransferase family 4 protein n=1 Tax=Butyricimonas TaxID=574697 RepID=UPI0007FB59BC|nr:MULTISPECIES: glycosyltransferase family 4 protein [Butyricimonas]